MHAKKTYFFYFEAATHVCHCQIFVSNVEEAAKTIFHRWDRIISVLEPNITSLKKEHFQVSQKPKLENSMKTLFNNICRQMVGLSFKSDPKRRTTERGKKIPLYAMNWGLFASLIFRVKESSQVLTHPTWQQCDDALTDDRQCQDLFINASWWPQ